MTDSAPRLPARPSLEQLHKQAKELLRQYRAGNSEALARFRRAGATLDASSSVSEERHRPRRRPLLADAQFVLAREYGFESWAKFKRHIEAMSSPALRPYQCLAADILTACRSDNPAALERITELYGRTYPHLDRRTQLRHHLTALRGTESRVEEITLDDAHLLVARRFGFDGWADLVESVAQPQSNPISARIGTSATPPFYKIDWDSCTIETRPPFALKDWDQIFEIMKEHRIRGLNAAGQMTDAAMERLADLEQITSLNLGGSKQLTDEGLKHLARMTQLERLELGGGDSPITDRGLEVLRHLTELRIFQCYWSRSISDTGFANLSSCDKLETVDLLGSNAGDGTIRALVDKPKLRLFKSGKQVTDAGIPLLHQFPAFKTWQGGAKEYSLMSPDAGPTHLLLDGPFTNRGLSRIVGLDGLFGLTFFWHASALTSDGLKPLQDLPILGFLGCQDQLCDNQAMRLIGGMPGLCMLMGQGAVAGDDGFVALSRSRTIEYIWGRDCPNFASRGFAALADMPALRGLAVSCKNVDDLSLSGLPRFPALRGLMPMDVSDEGFRHVGRCTELEGLWCMYCRDTGDVATSHLQGLSKLKTYYAGATQITDRSLEILARLKTLETIEFYQCAGITNAGAALLTSLPNLREISVGGSPNVTREGMAVFPSGVRVDYW
jgi:hypothetical protein